MGNEPRQAEHRRKKRSEGWRDISVFLDPDHVRIIEAHKTKASPNNVDVIRAALKLLEAIGKGGE